jgi:hypothetical protein
MALESAENAIEAALLDLEPAFQGLNHLPMGVRVFQMHVKRGRIRGADPLKSSLAAPQFHAALEVRVKNPHAISPQRLWMEPAFSLSLSVMAERIKGEAWKEGECDGLSSIQYLSLLIIFERNII